MKMKAPDVEIDSAVKVMDVGDTTIPKGKPPLIPGVTVRDTFASGSEPMSKVNSYASASVPSFQYVSAISAYRDEGKLV